jgi:hypothetical protein
MHATLCLVGECLFQAAELLEPIPCRILLAFGFVNPAFGLGLSHYPG